MDAANVLDPRHIILTHCVRQRPKGARGRAFTIIDCTGLHAFEILDWHCCSYPGLRFRHFCIGDSPPPREPTWLLIKMELPCSPSSRLFNNTSTYYCSQTQISQLLNNSKCFPDREEYSNREELISQKKCEYGKHLGRMSLPSSKLSNPVLWRSGNRKTLCATWYIIFPIVSLTVIFGAEKSFLELIELLGNANNVYPQWAPACISNIWH